MNSEDIEKMAANVRHHALKEAAQAICPYCRDGNPWSDAQCRDGMGYDHMEQGRPDNMRPCAAGDIWKLVDASQNT